MTDVGDREISLDALIIDEVEYVSVQALVEQAGGSFNVLPTRLRVDLGGSTAWLRIGESRVNALSIFSLRHAVTEQDGAPMIAAIDVPDFFLKSFRTVVRTATAPPPPPSAVTPDASSVPGETGPPSHRTQVPAEPAELEQLGTPAATPVSVTTIIIDAGHGGYDTGVQFGEALTEDVITLDVAQRVKALLDAEGRLTTILTRSEDIELAPGQRSAAARDVEGSLFISLHLGSSLSPAVAGVAAFHSPVSIADGRAATSAHSRKNERLAAESKRLAESLAAAVAASATAPLRGVTEAPLKILGDLQIPSAQIELGCLSNPDEAQRFSSSEHLAKLAAGVFNGIASFLQADEPDAGAASSPAVIEEN